jgi:tetratricopeptide (TPR) repeat protein
MKRAVWLIIIFVAAAAITYGVTTSRRARLEAGIEANIEAAGEMSEASEQIAAYIAIAQNNDSLKTEQIQSISDGIAQVAYDTGEGKGLVAACDSLLALELPAELGHRLTAELHSGLVIQGYYEEEGGRLPYWKRASEVARGLLEDDGVPPDVLLGVASFHGYSLDFVQPEEVLAVRDHWLPYDLASKGFNCLDGPVTTSDTAIMSGALGGALGRTSEAYGVERSISVTDSLLALDPCPSMRTIVLENRYVIAVDHDPDIAILAAREISDIGRRPGMWPLLRAVSLDMAERKLDPHLAVELSEAAMGLVEDRADSGRVFFALGQAQRAAGNLDEAAAALDIALAADDEVPELDDPRVEALLEVYEEAGDSDGAIDLLSRLMARSVTPNEGIEVGLGELLDAAGRSRDEIPALMEARRYAGVRQAPDFTLVDRAGADVSLTSLRGNVVLLCFWSYG